MSSIKSRLSKQVLALILALLLTVSMLPVLTYSASAATYFAATGVVTDAGMSTITILSSAKYRNFSKEDAKIVDPYGKGLALGDTVKIIYNAKHPQVALQINVIAHNPSSNRVTHDSNDVLAYVGVVNNIGMSAISLNVNGKQYNFSKEDAHILNAPDGFMVGDRVRVIAYSKNPSVATQILMITPGRGHKDHDSDPWSGSGSVANRSFTGWVPDMGGNYVAVQDLQTGKSLTFFYDDTNDELPEIAIGDVIKVLYNDENPGTALRIVMVDQGTNH